MGGRKSYSLEAVVGKTNVNDKARKQLVESVKTKEPKDIVQSTLELAASSEKLVNSLSEAVKAIDFVRKNANEPTLSPEDRKRIASEYWVKQKEESKIPSDTIEDNLVVNSIAKFIFRGRRK